MSLQDIPNNEILHKRLVTNFEGMGEFKSPGKLVLTQAEHEIINKEYTKFLEKVSCYFAIMEAFELILKNDAIASFDYFYYI